MNTIEEVKEYFNEFENCRCVAEDPEFKYCSYCEAVHQLVRTIDLSDEIKIVKEKYEERYISEPKLLELRRSK